MTRAATLPAVTPLAVSLTCGGRGVASDELLPGINERYVSKSEVEPS